MRKKTALLHLCALMLLSALTGCSHPQARSAADLPPPAGGQGIRGTLTHRGEPVRGAMVYVYRNSDGNLLGPADFASAPSPADGTYRVDLVGGSYWVVARRRAGGAGSGPVGAGDLAGYPPLNPVAVREGAFTGVDLELAIIRDPAALRSAPPRLTGRGVRGRILDEGGRPAPWAFALAYRTSDMKRAPDYTSDMTGSDGAFTILLPAAGRYWLAARTTLRRRPVSGEPYGLYAGTPDHSVEVPEGGFAEGVTITLRPYRASAPD